MSGRSGARREEHAPESGRIRWEEVPKQLGSLTVWHSLQHSLPAGTLYGAGLERTYRQKTSGSVKSTVCSDLLLSAGRALTAIGSTSDSFVLNMDFLTPQDSLYSHFRSKSLEEWLVRIRLRI